MAIPSIKMTRYYCRKCKRYFESADAPLSCPLVLDNKQVCGSADIITAPPETEENKNQ